MSKTPDDFTYLTSEEAKKVIKVSDCKLAHLRMDGKLPFVKKGNAYLYEMNGLNSELNQRKKIDGA